VPPQGAYPAALNHVGDGREKEALGKAAGLTPQFGVNLTRSSRAAGFGAPPRHEKKTSLSRAGRRDQLIEAIGETSLKHRRMGRLQGRRFKRSQSRQ